MTVNSDDPVPFAPVDPQFLKAAIQDARRQMLRNMIKRTLARARRVFGRE